MGQDGSAQASVAFDATVTLSPDLLGEYGLTEDGHAAEAAARLAVERLPGAVGIRIHWRGPLVGVVPPPLVSLVLLGTVAPATGHAIRAFEELAEALVHDALRDLGHRPRR